MAQQLAEVCGPREADGYRRFVAYARRLWRLQRADFIERAVMIDERRPKFFCLNSTKHTDIPLEVQAVEVKRLLTSLFPFPSPFERDS
jgi:hypothetical protein